MTQDQIDWIVSVTSDKLKDSFLSKQLSETEYNTELTKLNLWAEKTYKQLEQETIIEQEVLEEKY